MNFSEYVKVAFEELQLKQELLIQKIGSEYLNFEPDDLAGKIRFYHKETKETHAEFGVVLVGSYHLHRSTWQCSRRFECASIDTFIGFRRIGD